MISALYTRWINAWEHRLCFRSTDRIVRPFEWGDEWSDGWPTLQRAEKNGDTPEQWLLRLNRTAIARSDEFFTYQTPEDFRLEGGFVRFTSSVRSPYPANNLVHGQWFPAKNPNGKAVIVLPHWNASRDQHGGLCAGMAKFGLSAVRLSLPYHDYRMPAELNRADFAMSSNIGRTIDAARQAVADIRAMIDWLYSQGYTRVGICGTSIGSCYACLASAHDERIAVNVFNHCSTYVADVVWTGLSTLHVKKGLQEQLDLDRLRALWDVISPVNYLEKLAAHKHKRSLFIYAKYDTTFIPRLSLDIINRVQELGIANKVVSLPCGHYTMGETPFKFLDGYYIINFLKRSL
ncbi:MAG: abhydrolase domain-containing 18 [Acidobacteria bacterium]|nr:abhydrolase domain-containing 18 [Acidobacteriota bacterium]